MAICKHDICLEQVYAAKLCKIHYQEQLRKGVNQRQNLKVLTRAPSKASTPLSSKIGLAGQSKQKEAKK